MTRIGIIGPLLPYKGGIATHTTRLFQELNSSCEVHCEAFDTPFPKWIYPGQHMGQLGKHPNKLPGAHYELSWMLPGEWPRLIKRLRAFQPRAVIIPWWTFFFAPHVFYTSRKLKKANIPVVLLCHNLFDHEAAWWKHKIAQIALSQADGFIFHSPIEESKCKALYPSIPTLCFPHPIYDHLPRESNGLKSKSRIELLHFGYVRPYKGLEDLIDAYETINNNRLRLTIAGEWWGKQNELHARCRLLEASGRLQLIDHFLSDDEAANVINGSDAIILPYRKATNSGVLANAIHARKPVIVTDTGALAYSVNAGKTGLIVPASDPKSLQSAIFQIYEMIMDGFPFADHIDRLAKSLSWTELANRINVFVTENVSGSLNKS